MRLSFGYGLGRGGMFLIFAASLGAMGCGASTGTVSGKVLYHDVPLKGGKVIFFPDEGNPVFSDIGQDGTYTVEKAPVGAVKITVETNSLKQQASLPRYAPPPGRATPEANPQPDPAELARRYVPIPDLYGDPKTTTLSYTVKPGPQQYDVPLK